MQPSGTASTSLTLLAVRRDVRADTGSRGARPSFTVADRGSRQRQAYGGNHEGRIRRSLSSDQTASGWPDRGGNLSRFGPVARLVPSVVAPLSRQRPRWAIRSDPCAPATPAAGTRGRTHHPLYSATARVTSSSSDPLQPHRGQSDCSRTQGLGHSALTRAPHHRARAATAWHHRAAGAPGALPSRATLSALAAARLQPAAPVGPGRADLPEGPAAALLHLRLQGRLRWRRVPEIRPFPAYGSRADLPGRLLEEPRPVRATAVRQCPRISCQLTGQHCRSFSPETSPRKWSFGIARLPKTDMHSSQI